MSLPGMVVKAVCGFCLFAVSVAMLVDTPPVEGEINLVPPEPEAHSDLCSAMNTYIANGGELTDREYRTWRGLCFGATRQPHNATNTWESVHESE